MTRRWTAYYLVRAARTATQVLATDRAVKEFAPFPNQFPDNFSFISFRQRVCSRDLRLMSNRICVMFWRGLE